MTGPSLEVYSKDHAGNVPFAYAVEKGHARTVEVILRHYPNLGTTCDRYKDLNFHKAIKAGNIEMVEAFLDNGADIEMEDGEGRRALHMAIGAQSMWSSTKSLEMIQLLLARGARVNAEDRYGSKQELYT